MAKGGEFLLPSETLTNLNDVFTVYDFTEDQRLFRDSLKEFMAGEVLPQTDKIESKDWSLIKTLLLQLGESGALGVGGLFQADSASTFAGLATFSTMKITSGAGAGKVLTSDSSGNASWKSLGALPVTSGGGIPDNMRIFDSNGTWVVPDGVTKIMIEAWGGGGGGSGSGISDGNIGGGGGGGGYTKKIVRVSGGDTVNITIGGGGSGGGGDSE